MPAPVFLMARAGSRGAGRWRLRVGRQGRQLLRVGQLDAELVLEALAQLVDVTLAVLDRPAQALDRALAQLVLVELLRDVVDLVLDLVGRLRVRRLGVRLLALGLGLGGALLLLGRGELAAGRGRVRRRDARLVGAEDRGA